MIKGYGKIVHWHSKTLNMIFVLEIQMLLKTTMSNLNSFRPSLTFFFNSVLFLTTSRSETSSKRASWIVMWPKMIMALQSFLYFLPQLWARLNNKLNINQNGSINNVDALEEILISRFGVFVWFVLMVTRTTIFWAKFKKLNSKLLRSE